VLRTLTTRPVSIVAWANASLPMNALAYGFGYVIPTPRSTSSQLGNVVYIDDGGVVCEVGSIFDDGHFKNLLNQNSTPPDRTTTEVEYLSTTAVFATGSIDVVSLNEAEYSTCVSFLGGRLSNRSVVLDNEIVPGASPSKASCGWLFTRKTGTHGPGDAITLGPSLRKVRLNLREELVTQWVKDAPRKSTLWTARGRKLLPKLLVVLDEWTGPSWTRISWGNEDCDPGPTAVGLLMTEATSAPVWRYLALSRKTTTSFKLGNTSVIVFLIIC
jgi:hypothetical protein